MKTLSLVILMLAMLQACSSSDKNDKLLPSANASGADQDESGASIFHLESVWHTEEGDSLPLAMLKGKVLVMVMIYTSCKAACPRLVADMKAIHGQIPPGLLEEIQFVLVSIDPENDTPQRLKSFAIAKDMDGKEWTFLQGTPESTREFANVLSVKYKEISPVDFSHSNIISVFNRSGELIHQQEGLGVNNATTVQSIITTAKHP